MKIHREFEQKSLAWMRARAGIPTASEFGSLVTPKWEVRTGEMPKTYLASKAAEWWTGGPLAGFTTFATDQGNILEDEARPYYEWEFGDKVEVVGLCTNDEGTVACSPDGLVGDDGGLEIKCPSTEKHCGYLLAGEVPKDYVAQVQGSLFVTGRKWWRFLSYCRSLPPLVLTVYPDPEAQEAIAAALAGFLAKLESAKQRLIEINGGPPVRNLTPLREEDNHPMKFADDLIP